MLIATARRACWPKARAKRRIAEAESRQYAEEEDDMSPGAERKLPQPEQRENQSRAQEDRGQDCCDNRLQFLTLIFSRGICEIGVVRSRLLPKSFRMSRESNPSLSGSSFISAVYRT
jgi:hypothetical protein